jgi:hypothetical protein
MEQKVIKKFMGGKILQLMAKRDNICGGFSSGLDQNE